MATANSINASQKGVQMFNGTSVWTQGAYVGCYNIGIAYSAGTFTVQGSDGTALSATNPAYVTFQSKATPGRLVTVSVTANQTFTDGSSGTTDNQRFGLLTGNVWGANDIPFFLYAVINDASDTVAFMISRNSAAVSSPAAASIGKSGSIVNVDQGDFFSLASITTTDYNNNPCQYIGCFRMQFTGATDSWTVTTLDNTIDGVGKDFDNFAFNYPVAVQGAAAGSFFLANGGTAPIWTSQAIGYKTRRDGMVSIGAFMTTNTTAGTGAVLAKCTLPYTNPLVLYSYIGSSYFKNTSTGVFTYLNTMSDGTAQPYMIFIENAVANNSLNTHFAANSSWNCNVLYQVY